MLFVGISLFANREMHVTVRTYSAKWSPYPAATQAVPGGLPGRGRAPRGHLEG